MHEQEVRNEGPDDFLLFTEVARICRVPVSTVRHWVATGLLSSIRPARRRLVRRSELQRFLASSARRSR
ncbi:MAG TPA: helix-turn-helix domain-containing protein [Polyangia bacterium]